MASGRVPKSTSTFGRNLECLRGLVIAVGAVSGIKQERCLQLGGNTCFY